MRAAATGVPNSAPNVAAVERPIHWSWSIFGMRRTPTATTIAALITMIGLSGPRLTPPASARIAAIARPGVAPTEIGVDTNSCVAGSSPAWPGANRITSPTRTPAMVSTSRIHHQVLSVMPSHGVTVCQRKCSRVLATAEIPHSSRAHTTPTRRATGVSASSFPTGTRVESCCPVPVVASLMTSTVAHPKSVHTTKRRGSLIEGGESVGPRLCDPRASSRELRTLFDGCRDGRYARKCRVESGKHQR